jgi:hypothetical protein
MILNFSRPHSAFSGAINHSYTSLQSSDTLFQPSKIVLAGVKLQGRAYLTKKIFTKLVNNKFRRGQNACNLLRYWVVVFLLEPYRGLVLPRFGAILPRYLFFFLIIPFQAHYICVSSLKQLIKKGRG